MSIKDIEFNKYGNNIIIYYDQASGKWINIDEYHELLKQRPLPLKKIKNIRAIAKGDNYYIFFKERIEKELTEQIKMEGICYDL